MRNGWYVKPHTCSKHHFLCQINFVKIRWFIIPFLSKVLDSVRFSSHWPGCFSFGFILFVFFVFCLVGGVDVSRATEPTYANHNDQKPKGREPDDKTTNYIPYRRFWFSKSLKWITKKTIKQSFVKRYNLLLFSHRQQ